MYHGQVLRIAAFLIVLCPLLSFAATGAAEPRRNLLLIMIDTVRADRLGAYGRKEARTPHLDALAAKGLFFEQAVCQAPLTLPSHTSLLTGRYPHHHGIRDNAGSVGNNETTLAEILRGKGYNTYAAVGGFPLDHRFGLNQGFDVYNDEFPRERLRPLDFGAERPADAVVAAVLQMKIREPYFLWVHFYDPHAPYRNGGYEGEIAFVDTQVGRLLKSLPVQNTMVAVAGDHGESLGEHGEWTHRIFVYDSTMRVPFWISGPGVAAQRVKEQVRLIDFLPTALSLLQFKVPAGLDGVVLPAQAAQPAVLESLFPQYQLGWSPLLAIRTGEWKYIEAPKPELYDLRTDPAERSNAVASRPEIAKKLRAQLPAAASRAAAPPMDPEMAEQLASLGYVSGGSGPGSGADPKDRIAIWNEIEKAVDLEKTNPKETIAVLERARKADPQNPMILNFLAEKYATEGNLALADKVLTDLLKRDPENVLALSRSANVQLRMGRAASAKRIAENLLKSGTPGPEAHLIAAQACLQMNDAPCAENHLRGALERDPDDPETRNDLGNLRLQQGDTDAAVEQFKRVLQKDARNVQALNGLATAAFLRKQYAECESHLQQAAKIDPKDPQTKMNLALLYTRTGRVADSIALYQELIADAATPPEWKAEASARLKELRP